MKCERCNNNHDGTYGSGRFCSITCAMKRVYSNTTKKKISIASSKLRHTEETKRKIGSSINKQYYKNVESLYNLSSRTIRKILERMNIPCSNCNWNEYTCDLHHINGRKIDDPHNHNNLCYLCPNCHRLADKGILKKESLIPLTKYIKDNWKKYYYTS